jgi:subtilisin family serine protease
MRLAGTVSTVSEPYLSLSGTSMASPVVSGTIALMLQANPSLTPNLVKAILQYTAEERASYDGLTQGAGFLNARGAVTLARSLSAGAAMLPTLQQDPTPWSGHVIWGNQRVGGGQLRAAANAWRNDVIWGSTEAPDGTAISLGAQCAAGAASPSAICDGAAWDPSGDGDDVVWGAVNVWAAAAADPGAAPLATSSTRARARSANADDVIWRIPAVRRVPRILVAIPTQR